MFRNRSATHRRERTSNLQVIIVISELVDSKLHESPTQHLSCLQLNHGVSHAAIFAGLGE